MLVVSEQRKTYKREYMQDYYKQPSAKEKRDKYQK